MTRTVLIMAGGRGTRLWPLSRRASPKQFAQLASEKPLLLETYERLLGLVEPTGVFVIADGPLTEISRKFLPGVPAENFIVEPSARNSGPAALLGTLVIRGRFGEDALVAMMPADHVVPDKAAFAAAGARAYEAAAEPGNIATFGIEPARVDTHYGYIEAGALLLQEDPRVYAVRSFTEKPDEETAKRYLAAGNYYWNSGMFFWRADTFVAAWRRLRPGEAGVLDELDASARDGVWPKGYDRLEAASVDYAIMERHRPVVMVKPGFTWDDVGTYESLERVRAPDPGKNVLDGEVYTVGSFDNVVLARGGRPVVVVGAKGLVIVDAGDVILVYPKGEGARVREAVELIEKERPDLS